MGSIKRGRDRIRLRLGSNRGGGSGHDQPLPRRGRGDYHKVGQCIHMEGRRPDNRVHAN